jgi:hypothetical protein
MAIGVKIASAITNRIDASVNGCISASPTRMNRNVELQSRHAIHHTASTRSLIGIANGKSLIRNLSADVVFI